MCDLLGSWPLVLSVLGSSFTFADHPRSHPPSTHSIPSTDRSATGEPPGPPATCLQGHGSDAIWDIGQPCRAQTTHWELAVATATRCTACCGQTAVHELTWCLQCRLISNMSQAGVTRGTGNTGTASATPLSDARGEPVVSAHRTGDSNDTIGSTHLALAVCKSSMEGGHL